MGEIFWKCLFLMQLKVHTIHSGIVFTVLEHVGIVKTLSVSIGNQRKALSTGKMANFDSLSCNQDLKDCLKLEKR